MRKPYNMYFLSVLDGARRTVMMTPGRALSLVIGLLLAPKMATYVLPSHAAVANDFSQRRRVPHVVCSIQEDMKARMKAAMKGGADAKQELSAVRLIVAAMTTKAKETGLEALDDDGALAVLTKLGKMRKESIDMYEKAGAAEKAAGEKFEVTTSARNSGPEHLGPPQGY